jgi:hypothetical protein
MRFFKVGNILASFMQEMLHNKFLLLTVLLPFLRYSATRFFAWVKLEFMPSAVGLGVICFYGFTIC